MIETDKNNEDDAAEEDKESDEEFRFALTIFINFINVGLVHVHRSLPHWKMTGIHRQ